MIPRDIQPLVNAALARQAAVAIIGPRQVGKTTLAHQIAAGRPSLYLDLEDASDREKLAEPRLYLDAHVDKLVILDEIHRVPALFEALRGIIDAGRRAGHRTGRFLMLGSASIELLRQSSDTSITDGGRAHRVCRFFRTAAGAEIDLLLEFCGRRGNWVIEIKKSLAPKTDKGFHIALDDLKPERAFVVYAGTERYPKAPGIEAIGLRELAREIAAGHLAATG